MPGMLGKDSVGGARVTCEKEEGRRNRSPREVEIENVRSPSLSYSTVLKKCLAVTG